MPQTLQPLSSKARNSEKCYGHHLETDTNHGTFARAECSRRSRTAKQQGAWNESHPLATV